jgi:putative toxin-antitoxin system antitoxin component (TIGR02293 family)
LRKTKKDCSKNWKTGQMSVTLGHKAKVMAQKKYENKRSFKEEKVIVSEPAIAYTLTPTKSATTAATINSLKRPVAMLGLSFTKPYNEVETQFDFIECIRKGLPKKALDNLVTVTGFSTAEVSTIIHTSDRTLRRYTSQQKLDAEQSERVIELAKLYSRGEEIFGNLEAFKSWMNREVIALGNKTPKSFLDTSLGIEMLFDELGRIEHGVFA